MWSQIFLGSFLVLVTTVVGLFLVSVLDAVMWAHVYLRVGAIEQLETALYFSMVTFTTLGYGDVTLPDDWRHDEHACAGSVGSPQVERVLGAAAV